MARTRNPPPTLPACYAVVLPGLEEVASAEIEQALGGEVKRSTRGVVVFRLEEIDAVEFWLTIDGATAVCGLRLSDKTMRHRTYKGEHLPASLRPTVAAAMVRLAEARAGQVVLDPTCGAGTILAEQFLAAAKF